MPTAIRDPIPQWLKDAGPANASVFDSLPTTILRKLVGWSGVADPQAQVAAPMTPMETGPVGGIMGALGKAIRAYHGSPHDFDRFDLSKIGSGEGAQAYGHGLYFAESPGVAQSYRDALASPEVNVRGVPGVTWEHLGPGIRGAKKGSLDAARASGKFTPAELDAMGFMSDANLDDTIKSMREQGAMTWRGAEARKLWNQRADILEQLKVETRITPGGKMYEVSIAADPASFLDWDAPLSAQSSSVREALKQRGLIVDYPVGERFEHPITGRTTPTTMRGGDAYTSLREAGATRVGATPTEIATLLRDAGIPGTRYLDAGSRTAGEGSRNYVIWDPKVRIDILRKYGILPPIIGASALGALASDPARDSTATPPPVAPPAVVPPRR